MRAVVSPRRVAPDPYVLQVHIRPLLCHRADNVRVVRATCEERRLLEFSLRLSRACVSKTTVFSMKYEAAAACIIAFTPEPSPRFLWLCSRNARERRPVPRPSIKTTAKPSAAAAAVCVAATAEKRFGTCAECGPARRRSLCLSFPYVCPEPVLV